MEIHNSQMSLEDKYWNVVKKPISEVSGRKLYHIPNANCGYPHLYEAKLAGDINCFACIELIKKGYDHKLPEGKSLSNKQLKQIKWLTSKIEAIKTQQLAKV